MKCSKTGPKPEHAIEKQHMTKKRRNIVVIWETIDFVWDEANFPEVMDMWNVGIPLEYIARNFDRDEDETGLLIMWMCRYGMIESRPGGMDGRKSRGRK